MNVRRLVPSVNRLLLPMPSVMLASLLLATGLQQPVHAADTDLAKFRRIEP